MSDVAQTHPQALFDDGWVMLTSDGESLSQSALDLSWMSSELTTLEPFVSDTVDPLSEIVTGDLTSFDVAVQESGTAILTSSGYATAILTTYLDQLYLVGESLDELTDEGGEPLYMG